MTDTPDLSRAALAAQTERADQANLETAKIIEARAALVLERDAALARAEKAEALLKGMAHGCRAGRDGECNWDGCPQKADWQSHCPYDIACGDPGCDASSNVARALVAQAARIQEQAP